MKRGHEARRKNEERTQELEEEKVRRKKAEKVLKEFQSRMTGKSVDKLEAQKRERVKKAEKRKEAFKKKQAEKTRFEDSNNVRKRKDFTAIPQECKNCPMVGWASRLWGEVIELKIRGQDQLVQMSSF